MTTLSKEHHKILKALVDTKLAFRDEERDALETLIAATVDKTDTIEHIDRIRMIERGLEHVMAFVLVGPYREGTTPAQKETPAPEILLIAAHLQGILNVLNGTMPTTTLALCAQVLVERCGFERESVEAADRAYKQAAVATGVKLHVDDSCSNPSCKVHRRWWRVD